MLVDLADLLGAFGERLRAGDLVICGSTVPPPFIERDEDGFQLHACADWHVSVVLRADAELAGLNGPDVTAGSSCHRIVLSPRLKARGDLSWQ